MATSMLARSIQLCDQVKEATDESSPSVKIDCDELKAKTERLAGVLGQAARIGSDLYERPARLLLKEAERGLEKALALTLKTRASIVNNIFAINRTTAFKKVSAQLENSIVDISWLLSLLSPDHRGDENYIRLPPIAAKEPILCLIWENIAKLLVSWSTLDARADAADYLASLAKDNDRYASVIIEEGGVGPLIRLLRETSGYGPESATRALGLLACCPESLQLMVDATFCSAFNKILKEESMKTQSIDANPLCQQAVAKRNIIRLLVSHLYFETVQEHKKKAGVVDRHHNAEKEADLPSSWFMPNSPEAKAIVDQLLEIVEKADSELLIPCVKAIGCLARTFRTTESRIIAPLVKLLDERVLDVTKETVQALVKFAATANYLHVDHSKAILDAGGARRLVQLVYFGGAGLQVDALVLLCYIAQHVPDSEALAQAEVLTVLEWAFKQAALVKDEMVQSLLPMATALLVFQTRGKRDIVELLLLRGSTVIEGSAQESLTISDVSLEEEEFDVKDYEKEVLASDSSHENTYNQDILPTPRSVDLPENNPIDTQNKLLDYDGNNGESKSMAISNCEAQGQQMDKINLVAYETTPTDTSSDTLHSFTEGHLSYKDKQRLKIFNLIKDAVNDLKEASVFETLDIEKELRQLLDIGCRYDIQVQPLHSLLNEVSRLNESFSLDELDKHTLAKETLEKQNIILSSQMVDLRSTWDATEERLNYITQRLKELHDEEQSTTDFLVLQQSQIEQVQKAIVANEEALDVASSHIEALRARSTMAEDEFKALVNNFTFELAI